MDLKWPEMSSKVYFGHAKWPIDLTWPEMRSKVILDIQNGRRKRKILYRSKMARIAIESEFQTSKMADRSEMCRNAIKGDFRTSKMADGNHYVKVNFESEFRAYILSNISKKIKLYIDLKWPEMRSKVNFGHPNFPRWPFCKK